MYVSRPRPKRAGNTTVCMYMYCAKVFRCNSKSQRQVQSRNARTNETRRGAQHSNGFPRRPARVRGGARTGALQRTSLLGLLRCMYVDICSRSRPCRAAAAYYLPLRDGQWYGIYAVRINIAGEDPPTLRFRIGRGADSWDRSRPPDICYQLIIQKLVRLAVGQHS